jgi:hypothetical protein
MINQDGPGVPAGGGAPAEATPSVSPTPAAAPTPARKPLTVAPDRITVNVVNGTSTTGLAAKAAAALRSRGFGIGTVGNAPAPVDRTVVRYGPGAGEKARTVAAAVRGSVLKADPAAGAAVQVVVGPNWSTVVAVHTGPPPTASASATSPARTASATPMAASAAPQSPAAVRC